MIGNALPSYFLRGKHKKIWITIPLCLALLSTTGCDYVYSKFYPKFKKNEEKAVVDAPPFARKNAIPNISIEKVRDIADNTSLADNTSFTVNPVAIKDQKKQPKDSNLLFTEPTATPEDRFHRIENNVQRISDTLNRMSPSITKLIGIESELDALTFQLEELINKGVFDEKEDRKQTFVEETRTTEKTLSKGQKSETIMLKPASEPIEETKMEKNKPAPQKKKSSSNKIKAGDFIHTMRLGDHSGKARIVFETTEKLDYSLNIDNDEKIITIEFSKGNVGSDPNIIAYVSDLVKSITQNKEGDGTILAFKLTQDTEKLKEFRISPDKEIPRHRIVIDLKL